MTLRENNLKEIDGGKILESQGVLVANKQALKREPRLMNVVHELIERFEVTLQSRNLAPMKHRRSERSGKQSS